MYMTGDLGRWKADGTIEFLGRNDFQVKVRGYRVELGEIEACLKEHEEVREAVALAREDTSGDKRLVAYYTCTEANAEESESLGVEPLRRHVSAKLPEYMVPAAYVRLEKLPLTPNGKLDRKALPVPKEDAYGVARDYEEPVGEIERAVAEIWAQVLKVERVGRRDNFFELGGHSLLSVRVIANMRRAGLEVDLQTLFATPMLAELAAGMEKMKEIIL
jgi:non-ribosomal peptide synthetase component F